jgi:hypothetical protein
VTSESGAESDVVFKNECVFLIAGSNCVPNRDMRARHRDFRLAHPDGSVKLDAIWHSKGLRLDKELVAQGVEKLHVILPWPEVFERSCVDCGLAYSAIS